MHRRPIPAAAGKGAALAGNGRVVVAWIAVTEAVGIPEMHRERSSKRIVAAAPRTPLFAARFLIPRLMRK